MYIDDTIVSFSMRYIWIQSVVLLLVSTVKLATGSRVVGTENTQDFLCFSVFSVVGRIVYRVHTNGQQDSEKNNEQCRLTVNNYIGRQMYLFIYGDIRCLFQ